MIKQRSRGVLDRPVKPGDDSLVVADVLPSRSLFLRPLPAHAVFAAFNPSFDSTASRITNFWILPVTVIGNSSTNST
jgi:hypothetical protein